MRTAQIPASLEMETRIEEMVGQLVNESMQQERRAVPRQPYFRPAGIITSDNEKFTVFTKDISRRGVSLLHNMPLKNGKVLMSILRETGETVRFRTEIGWCKPCGEGWYLSGGLFLAVE